VSRDAKSRSKKKKKKIHHSRAPGGLYVDTTFENRLRPAGHRGGGEEDG